MANGGRRVVIDDTNPSIVYSTNPPWFLDDTGTTDNVGNFGKSLNTTLHGTTANSSFSFSFSGTAIDVYGTNSIRNSSGVIDPLWTCYLNGVQISSPPPFRFQENNWRMCATDGLLDMNHTFTLSVSTFGRPFLFDYLVYTPSPNSALQSDVILVPFSDSNLVYDSSWQFWSNLSALTRTRNAAVQFQFTGTSLSWYGIYPRELPIQPAAASFSIDGGMETPFVLQGLLSSNASTAYNQLLFRTDVYPHGLHTLIVNFKGANNTTPLSLAYILLQRDRSLGGTLTAPTHTGTAIAGSANRPSISIAGLVCGAVALCVVITALLVYFLILKKPKKKMVTNTSPTSDLPVPRFPSTTSRNFDLASSSPHLGVDGGIAENNRVRRLTWHEKLRTSFSAAFNRTPHLGMVVADASAASTIDPRKKPTSPQILSLWARRNFSRLGPQLITDEDIPHRPRLPPQDERQIPAMGDRPESGDVEHSVGNIPTSSLSLPIAPVGRSASSTDASYYGGYRTKREMIELERRQQPGPG